MRQRGAAVGQGADAITVDGMRLDVGRGQDVEVVMAERDTDRVGDRRHDLRQLQRCRATVFPEDRDIA
jgi:hypothetical protein